MTDLGITLLFIILATALYIDVLYRKIPNALTMPAIIFGILFHTYLNGISGLISSVEGLFVGLGIFICFYLAGVMGAGDVKLMGAVGSILGPAGVFRAFLFTAIVGGIYAVIILIYKWQFVSFMKRMASSLRLLSCNRQALTVEDSGKASPVLCYGIAIGIGTVLSILIK